MQLDQVPSGSGHVYRVERQSGHETTRTTDIYLHADLAVKERALARTTPPHTRAGRYRPPDSLLAFLESL
jgi:integrase/recombinase XerD